LSERSSIVVDIRKFLKWRLYLTLNVCFRLKWQRVSKRINNLNAINFPVI